MIPVALALRTQCFNILQIWHNEIPK
jgi:hypothetical protein